MTAADSAALNWWSLLYTIGAWLVVTGVALEGADIIARRKNIREEARLNGFVKAIVPAIRSFMSRGL